MDSHGVMADLQGFFFLFFDFFSFKANIDSLGKYFLLIFILYFFVLFKC